MISIGWKDVGDLSDRRVDMSDRLIAALSQLLTKRKREALKPGLGEPVPFIFHRDHKPMEQNYIRLIYKRVLTKAGIREMRLHDIRHTFASLLLSKGENPVYVEEQLAHSSIKISQSSSENGRLSAMKSTLS